MLVLTRKRGEEIVIGEDIRISVLRQRGGRVRLGITAPPAVHVARKEIIGTQPARTFSDPQALNMEHELTVSNAKGTNDVQQNNQPIRPR